MESLDKTISPTPELPKGTEFLPVQSGYAVTFLGDCPRTPKVTLPSDPEIPFKRIQGTEDIDLLLFDDATALLAFEDTLYPLPLSTGTTFSKSSITHLGNAVPWIAESDLEYTQYGLQFTPNLLTPAWRPLYPKVTPDEQELITQFGQSLLYYLSHKYPQLSHCYLRWQSQPVASNKALAPPKATLYTLDPKLKRSALMDADHTLNSYIDNLARYLPTLPGQSLREGKQKRHGLFTIQAPKMKTAHEKLRAEKLPFLPTLREFDDSSPWF